MKRISVLVCSEGKSSSGKENNSTIRFGKLCGLTFEKAGTDTRDRVDLRGLQNSSCHDTTLKPKSRHFLCMTKETCHDIDFFKI